MTKINGITNINPTISEEAFQDQYKIEMEKATDICNSMEAAFTMYENNLNFKLKMLKKINDNYGNLNRGIENYCRIQSLEADTPDNNTSSQPDQNSTPGSANQNNPNSQDNNGQQSEAKKSLGTKTREMLHKVQEAISNLINKIFQWIMNLINKFRYNNKIFENTINTINSATPEQLNKVSDDLKNVQFEGSGLIVMTKHPQETINKYTGTYQNLCSVFANAISAANTNPADITKIKDFAAKLKDFVKSIPDVGGPCPELQGEGIETLKQYKDALKTYCNETLNYKKQPKSFNSYFGGTETIEGKTTVGKLIGNVDPKAVITLIKTESEAMNKLNESLTKINQENQKTSKSINDIIKKIGVGDDQSTKNVNAQVQTLIAMEKALVQINSIFCGICSNSIKTLNTVKGKLIDFTKKNIGKSKEKKEENANNNQNNEQTKEDFTPFLDYQTDQFIASLESQMNYAYNELYSIEADMSRSMEVDGSDIMTDHEFYSNVISNDINENGDDGFYNNNNKPRTERNLDTTTTGLEVKFRDRLKKVFKIFVTIWQSLVSMVKAIINKIQEIWFNSKIKKMAEGNNEQKRTLAKFVQNTQQTMKKLNDCMLIVKNTYHRKFEKVKSGSESIAFFMSGMKLLMAVEKALMKMFSQYRKDVVKGNIKSVGSNHIEQITNMIQVNTLAYYKTADKISALNYHYNPKEVVKLFIDTSTIFSMITNSNFKVDSDTSDKKMKGPEILKFTDKLTSQFNEIINEEKTQKYMLRYLFGVEVDKIEDSNSENK